MKINKAKILETLKIAGKWSITLLARKSTWVAIGSGVSYLFTKVNENGELLIDPVTQSNVDFILHGIEVVTCALFDGCY